jgi:tRNA(Ile)-lysidine synthase TilS/MesJ
MPAKLPMFDGRVELIRPLILLTNNEIRQFASIMGFPTERAKCPFEDKTKRRQSGEIIADIEKRFPDARHNIFKSMQKIFVDYLPVENEVDPIIRGVNVKNRNS